MNTLKLHNSLFSLLLSALGGILLGLATNQVWGVALSPLGWVCLVPLYFSLKNIDTARHFFVRTYLFSVIFLSLVLTAFILRSFTGGILLITIGALFFTIPFWVVHICTSKIGFRKSLFLLALIWPAFDWFILERFLAMPILSVYLNQAALPWLIQYIDITGYTGISFWLVALNAFIFIMLDDWLERRKTSSTTADVFFSKRLALLFSVFFLPPLLYNVYVKATLPRGFGDEIRVSVVQSGYPSYETAGDEQFEIGFLQLVAVTDSLVAAGATDLIVWPESGVPIDFMDSEDVQIYLFQKVLEWETPLLTGTLDSEVLSEIPALQQYLGRDYKVYNSAIMLTPQLAWMALEENLDISRLRIYRKQNLMHFTEYVPLSETFPVLSNLSIDIGGVTNISGGSGPTILNFFTKNESTIRVSPIVCWDLLFTSSSSKSTASDAQFIAALTNESPLGDTFETTAHEMESFTRLRSIEARRSIAKSSTTGYSLFTDPFGNIYGKLDWYSVSATTQHVTLNTHSTFYSRFPNVFPLLSLFGGVLLLFFSKTKS
ncbi:MAG: apolipoprotein N-acyltransferase [Bacteroidetes bacterium]|nr:apolipoprotein N-acyltransferase [Bacteroidota bacterium]MCH8524749.1 apolipoprotein N-acyltransferase [Balneolales bacterium]